MKTKVLCILDGFGLAPASINNATSLAKMSNFKDLLANEKWSTLKADGTSVGQENGLVGNSEVGHMNLGGLKVVDQLSVKITKWSDEPDKYPQETLKSVVFNHKVVHIVGLFSTGTIHSDLRHWAGAIVTACKQGSSKVILHLISDGRDSNRESLLETWKSFVDTNYDRFASFSSKIFLGSVGGRFFAMDRDKNWDRIARGLSPIFNLEIDNQKYNKFGDEVNNNYNNIPNLISKITKDNYENKHYDESIIPEFIKDPVGNNDIVWFLNFRTDRAKQMCKMFCDLSIKQGLNLQILSMNEYGIDNEQQHDVRYSPLFHNTPVVGTVSELIEANSKTQLHIAETEKFNHVTYFFNGGQNLKQKNETWVVIDSNKVDSHDQMPEMKAKEITDYILENGLGKYDYIVVNYANPDMLGHTGNLEAAIVSLEFLDLQLGKLIEAVKNGEHCLIITADHGNVEKVGEDDHGKINTEHNASPVPLIFVGEFGASTQAFIQQLFVTNYGSLKDIDGWLLETEIPIPKYNLTMAGEIFVNELITEKYTY
jgi:2,3-bisphosphoglycerate-independent phosphoglycerate mutase